MSEDRKKEDRKKSGRRYRLVGIRRDHSQASVLGRMTWEEANRAKEVIDEAGLFVSVHVVLDSLDDAAKEE